MTFSKKQLDQLLEGNYKMIFDLMPEAVVILDKKGAMMDANEYFLDWLGYKKNDLVGKRLVELPCISKNSIRLILKNFKERMKGANVLPYEIELLTKKGGKKYGIIRGTALRDEAGSNTADLVMVTDISKAKESELALFESEEKFQTLFDDAQDMIAVIDTRKRFANANKRFLAVRGLGKSIIGTHIKECTLLTKESCKRADRLISSLLKNDFQEDFIEVEGSDGHGEKAFFEFYAIPSKKQGKTISVIVILRDITDEKIGEAKLKESEEKYRLIAENTSDFIAITDLRWDARYKYVNASYSRVLGYGPGELIGKEAKEYIHPDDLPAVFKVANKYIRKKAAAFLDGGERSPEFFSYRYRSKSGKWHYMETMANIARNNVIFISRDVSSRVRNEAIKTEFVSMASHQLRTPLTGIHWCAKLLESERYGGLTAEQKSLLDRIIKSNDRMTALVNDLLDVAKLDQIKDNPLSITKLPVDEILGEILEENAPLLEGNRVSIDNAIPEGTTIRADRGKMKHAFGNIVANAIKYSPSGGKVALAYRENGKEQVFSVQDKGIGIPLDQQDKIFSKLFRADNAAPLEIKGTGLGLYIAKSFIEMHKGKIWFRSKEGKGSTFYFSIPK